jgi:phospholipase/carboxylesterase
MLKGPEISTKSGNKPKQLIIFLHGVGADGEDLIELAYSMRDLLPDAYFISPNAPHKYDRAPFGYQWFSLIDTSQHALLQGLNSAMPHLSEFIDHQLKRFNLTEENLAVIGFSQGCMLALHHFPRQANKIALVACLSGMLVAPSLLEEELKSKPNILIMHGAQDQVVPLAFMKPGEQRLKKLDFDVKTHIYKELGHSILKEEIETLSNELKKIFIRVLSKPC